MKEAEYNDFIVNGYQDALSCLAMEFRSSRSDHEKQAKVVLAYNSILDLLLSLGWSAGLDPDSELPDGLILNRYIEITRSRPLSYVSQESGNT
ncbi:hypothetical protein [Rhodanobacter thiooxydans]|uniref:hypothetical protein n=1 Tax=Rhodanobacter thiooxydans TaxID=416169 RepID=UPI000A61E219|nr:hypothetical protein [Rhodanobacter thiooxydans]